MNNSNEIPIITEQIVRIDVRSAGQNLEEVARDIVNRLDRRYLQIVDLSEICISSDQEQIVVTGLKYGQT